MIGFGTSRGRYSYLLTLYMTSLNSQVALQKWRARQWRRGARERVARMRLKEEGRSLTSMFVDLKGFYWYFVGKMPGVRYPSFNDPTTHLRWICSGVLVCKFPYFVSF